MTRIPLGTRRTRETPRAPGTQWLSPLDRKLLRDLRRIKGQVFAIASVVAAGVALLVMMSGMLASLRETQRVYYQQYRFADVFAPVERAPDHVLEEIADLDGVAAVRGRVRGGALLDLPEIAVPITAQAVSLPAFGPPLLHDVFLRDGRMPDASREEEVLLLAGFAQAHDLGPGDELVATMNGKRRTLRIAGLAESPEFLFPASASELTPDIERYAVVWMSEEGLEAAYDLDGAFREALVSLTRNADLDEVLDRLDTILAPYGATGAYDRSDHLSHKFLSEEMKGLATMARILPPMFLAVAAFLLNIVVARLIQAERREIGLVKAFGYSDRQIALHYVKFVSIIAMAGALMGCATGVWMGHGVAGLYQHYYRFPFLVFEARGDTFLLGLAVAAAAAITGVAFALRQIFALTPAVAMQPPAPEDFTGTSALSARLERTLDQPSRMVLRRLLRQPVRSALTCIGVGVAMALSIAMQSNIAAFEYVVGITFGELDRSDVAVTFVEPLSDRTVYELQGLDGVLRVEPTRAIPAILRNGLHKYRGAITGLVDDAGLVRAVDTNLESIAMRDDGVILSRRLSETLHIRPGDVLEVDVREGRRPRLEVPVVGIANTFLGSPAYMSLGALNLAMREQRRASGAFLQIDGARREQVYAALKAMPAVAGVQLRSRAQEAFRKMMDEGLGAMRYIMAFFAAVITIGVVYNSARVAYAERAHDLASLRVLGFTRGETSFVLLGELTVLILLALPLGSALGYYFAKSLVESFSTDLYQIPFVASPASFGEAAVTVLVAAAASGLLVRRSVARIDMVSALKVRE